MKNFEQGKDLSFVETLIRLPTLKKLSPEESPFPKVEESFENDALLSNNLRKNLIEQREILKNEFYKYDTDQYFTFYFPDSKFPSVAKGEQNLISYEKKPFIEPENTFRDRLSHEQIEEIREKGEFSVKSQREWAKIPYTWKLNDTIFKGINRVKEDWNDRISVIHSFAHETWIMITEEFPEEIVRIVKFPYKLFCLLVGKQAIKVSYSIDYDREIAKDFWNEVMSGYYSESKEWFSQLWAFLDTKIYNPTLSGLNMQNKIQDEILKMSEGYDKRKKEQNDKIQQINKVSEKFDENWNKINKKIFQEIFESVSKKYGHNSKENAEKDDIRNKEKEEEILDRFAEEEFSQYTGYLSQELPKINIPMQVIEAILTLLTLINVTRGKERQFEERKIEERQNIEKLIREKHPILSEESSWFYNKIEVEFQNLEIDLKNQFYNTFIDENLNRKLSQKQIEVFKLWVEYLRNYEIKLQQKKEQKQDLYEPNRVFASTYPLLPPYQIIRHEANQSMYNNQAYYEIVKSRTISMSTGRYFWKFSLYFMRLKTWTIKCFVILIYSCLKGPFGLRCLCGVDQFSYDEDVNMMTGEIFNSMRKTVLGRFFDVMDGIDKSRTDFEELPDTGLFGKTCSRLYNLIECYVFRFFIVGIIIILTLYPVAMILVSLLSFLLIITIWIWMPIVLVFTYLFNILIYEFETREYSMECINRIFPLFALIFKLLFSICKIIFYIVSFFIITPLVSIAVFLYSCLCYCLRSIGDCVILSFVRCCGRTPNTNSVFATKISGPDMAIQQFMSLDEEDVYILIQSELEQIHLELIAKITKEKISQPYETFKKVLKAIIEPLLGKVENQNYYNNCNNLFNVNYHDPNNPIQESGEYLLKRFNEDFVDFKKRYPQRPYNVRFTSEELTEYRQNTQEIVKSYVNKNKLNGWIFDNYKIMEENYEELTRNLWITLFQCGEAIFEPLESIDQRFRLEDQYNDNDDISGFSYGKMKFNVNEVANAIRGEVDLKRRKIVKLSPSYPNFFYRKRDLVQARNIFDYVSLNSEQSVHFSRWLPTFIFFPHLSIKELSMIEEAQYLDERKKNTKNWEKW